MRKLHKNIGYVNPEEIIGEIIYEALESDLKIEVIKFDQLFITLGFQNLATAQQYLKRLQLLFINLSAFSSSISKIENKENKTSSPFHLTFKTTLASFDRFNRNLSYEYKEFDVLIEKLNEKRANENVKEIIDDFLVEIGYLCEKIGDIHEWGHDREWDIEYEKVVLALSCFKDEERFILFSKYVFYSDACLPYSREGAQRIWNKKKLWEEKYNCVLH